VLGYRFTTLKAINVNKLLLITKSNEDREQKSKACMCIIKYQPTLS
jgi:hypothetical protein